MQSILGLLEKYIFRYLLGFESAEKILQMARRDSPPQRYLVIRMPHRSDAADDL